MKKLLLIFFVLIFAQLSFAGIDRDEETEYNGPMQWKEFRKFVLEEHERDQERGLSYMISGGIAALGGTLAYQNAEEPFGRAMYAITANVGVAAIGLGATYYWTGNENDSFFHAIEGSSLSPQQKNEVLNRFLTRQRHEREHRRWIQVATHALIAVMNLYSAQQEKNADIQSVFYFLGGANAILAISYAF
jgi:hypothetical protein